MSKRDLYVFVCQNRRPPGNPKGSCATRGAEAVLVELKRVLAERGLAKVRARACGSTCQDICWAGPVIHVSPENTFYGRVTLADVPAIADAIATGGRVERLLLPPEDFNEATARPGLPETP